MKENRLVYMAGEGTPGAPSADPAVSPAAPAATPQQAPAVSPVEDEAKKKELEAKKTFDEIPVTTEQRDKLRDALKKDPEKKKIVFGQMADALKGPHKVPADDLELLLDKMASEATVAVILRDENVWKNANPGDLATFFKSIFNDDVKKYAKTVSITFVDEVARMLAKEAGDMKLTGIAGMYFTVSYDKDLIGVKFLTPGEAKVEDAKKAQEAAAQTQKPAEQPVAEKSKEDIYAEKLADNSMIGMVFGFLGIVDMKMTDEEEKGGAEGEIAYKQRIVGQYKKVLTGKDPFGYIACMFLGIPVAGGDKMKDFFGMIPEQYRGKAEEIAKKVKDAGDSLHIPDILGLPRVVSDLFKEITDAKGLVTLDRSIQLDATQAVPKDFKLIVEIPKGGLIDLKLKEKSITVKNLEKDNKKIELKAGEIKADDKMRFELVSGRSLGLGTTFDKGVILTLQATAAVPEASAPTPGGAVEKEAPEEKPAV